MKKRFKIPGKKSRRMFSRGANRTQKVNMGTRPRRGGMRF